MKKIRIAQYAYIIDWKNYFQKYHITKSYRKYPLIKSNKGNILWHSWKLHVIDETRTNSEVKVFGFIIVTNFKNNWIYSNFLKYYR